jgi:7-carboxy-7-deazaguanine synthase (Cx14CxxC type)
VTYTVKEIYYTLQGEGYHTGRPAVFLRFTGCNLWSGHEKDRGSAICRFCDTDFVGTDGLGGGKYDSAQAVVDEVARAWPSTAAGRPYVVCTGGEPLLQLDVPLIDALHGAGFEIGVETNGTIAAPKGIDWLCVSPKAGADLVQRSGDELKVVIPQDALDLEMLAQLDFAVFSVQPMDGPALERNTILASRYSLEHPTWRLSLQTHKLLGLP